jgi:phytanoyl-CoA hydroxylase
MLTGGALRAAMRDQGYAVYRSVVDVATLRRLRSEAAALIADFRNGSRSGPDYWSCALEGCAGPVLYRIHRLERQPGLSATLQPLADGSLRMLASEALGERAFDHVRCCG